MSTVYIANFHPGKEPFKLDNDRHTNESSTAPSPSSSGEPSWPKPRTAEATQHKPNKRHPLVCLCYMTQKRKQKTKKNPLLFYKQKALQTFYFERPVYILVNCA